jgi:hypothetical protein
MRLLLYFIFIKSENTMAVITLIKILYYKYPMTAINDWILGKPYH